MTGSEHSVTFYFGLGSRYSYLAATQIPELESRTGASVVWRPLLSSELFRTPDQGPLRWDAETNDWSGARVSGQYSEAYRQSDLARWAKLYEVPYQEPKPPVIDARRRTLFCVAAALAGQGQRFAQEMFKVIYRDGRAVDESICREIAAASELEPSDLVAVLNSGAAEHAHEKWIDQAMRAGVFGVPSFIYKGEVFWGNDRLPLLEAALTP